MGRRLGMPPRRWSDGQYGLHPTYTFTGTLVHLCWLHHGTSGNIALTLFPRQRKGKLEYHIGSCGTPDSVVYEKGRATQYDAWSDNIPPAAIRWSKWVRQCVTTIMGMERCLLCRTGLDESPGVAHTMDGYDHLCRPCYTHIQDTKPMGRQWPLGERKCGVCGDVQPDQGLMFEGKGGKICTPCATQITPIR